MWELHEVSHRKLSSYRDNAAHINYACDGHGRETIKSFYQKSLTFRFEHGPDDCREGTLFDRVA